MEDIKQIIVMRKDLNMRKGKMIAQGSHACLSVILRKLIQSDEKLANTILSENTYKITSLSNETYLQKWFNNSYKKICLYVNSEQELLDLYKRITTHMYEVSLIEDDGLTEFHRMKTFTCFAVEPLPSYIIDEFTGKLGLL